MVDLSIAIEAGLPSDPPMMIPKIDYVGHSEGAQQMKDFFPGLSVDQLPDSLGWSLEFVHLTTHSGTHLDAPYHYHPTMDKGKPAITIDQVPIEWCFSDGVLLDFRHKADGERITAHDVEKELKRIDYEIKPFDIVLVQTGADAFWGTPEYLVKGAGMDRESTLYLTGKGVKVVGMRRVELGQAAALSCQRVSREKGSPSDLGSPFRRHRDGILPHGKNG